MLQNAILTAALIVLTGFSTASADEQKPAEPAKVSYYKQVRPIFQAHCQGCHQPAKAGGKYVMTAFEQLAAGGESGQAAIVPGKPDESFLIEQITPTDGQAAMPQGRKPLTPAEIEIVTRWIAEGAADDTPAAARQRYDMERLPVYTRPPVVTSLDFSPDGSVIAVTGFHEVLLIKPPTAGDGTTSEVAKGEIVARLVGMSERIESVKFSPDGKLLAVAGGLPARMGEIQIWDVENRKLKLSVPVTYDTVYGARWSPDGKLIAFGCSDNTVRAIDATTGEQVLFQGAHTDWVRDTVFSADGSHLVSVGRDMTAKLTEVATQRFVDNVTSITPGALKGGIQAIARHPQKDEIVIGGSDGIPKVYRMHRIVQRVIGDDSNIIRELPAMPGRIWSVAVSADGQKIAAGSSLDAAGEVHVYDYPADTSLPEDIKKIMAKVVTTQTAPEKAALMKYITDGVRRVSQAKLSTAVYSVAFHPNGQLLAAAGGDGIVRFVEPGSGKVVSQFVPVPIGETVAAAATAETAKPSINFIRDVNPVLSRLGCNAGTCHGAAQGRNGFKLSLRGYDPIFDVRSFTDDLASRRVNLAAPDESLMLLKASGAVPHTGGQLVQPGEPYYQVIRDWIAAGAILDFKTARVAKIDVFPQNPVIEKPGTKQQFRVMAVYDDGATREVTQEAFVESGNNEVAAAERGGVMTALRRGEAPVLARFEGQYAATTLTVMGDRSGFTWEDPPVWNRIDELTSAKWQRMKIRPSGLSTDAEFIRRVYIDLTGLPPTSDEVRAFLADSRDTQLKRSELVDKLIGSPAFVEHWTNKWADLLQVNRKFLGVEGATKFRQWIRDAVEKNTPYDQFVHQILTASGSNRENPAASYYKILRDPEPAMENTTHLFLGIRFNCNKCHDHPFERWTQDQYYQLSAFFAQVKLERDPASGNQNIGGSAVEGAKPLYEIIVDKKDGEVTHQRTGEIAAPVFPYEVPIESRQVAQADPNAAEPNVEEASGVQGVACNESSGAVADLSRREQLAAWITSPKNPYFSRSYVNRLWGYLFGVGIMEPIDDLRAGNPPTNPELLDYLNAEFLNSKFDTRHILQLICKSRTYQLSVETNDWNVDDKINYSHALARRLPAEVLYDAVHRVTGSVSKLPGVKPGTRAAELPDSEVDLPSGFFTTFGRPPRESACECERTNAIQLGPVMALVSGPTVSGAISDPENELTKLVAAEADDRKLVNEVFLRVLNRPATDAEIDATLNVVGRIEADHARLTAQLKEREDYVKPIREKQENERQAAIAQAKEQLAAYEKELEPKLAQAEKEKAERTVKLETELSEYAKSLTPKLADSLKQQPTAVAWQAIVPKKAEASNGAKLTVAPDGTIVAEAKDGPVDYTITAETDLKDITGIRLEILADDSLPSRGPGLAPNGNLVITEFEMKVAPKSNPNQQKPVKLENPVADFAQNDFKIPAIIDGNRAGNNGWAVSPQTGQTHWATFEAKDVVGFDGGTVVTFRLEHRFPDNKHITGRFRISVTRAPKGFGLTYPGQISAILAVDPSARSEQQSNELLAFFQSRDEAYRTKAVALAESRRPLPTDPKLIELRNKLEFVSRPVPEDEKLVQLRQDVALSTQQVGNKRLTAVQDLAWALINSPEFLFNH